MTEIRVDFDHPRYPVWECPALLERAAALDELLQDSNQAVRPVIGDPSEVHSQSNHQTLFLGPQRLFHEQAERFVEQIGGKDHLNFSQDSPWFDGSDAIAGLIRSYFSSDMHGLASLSLTSMRRPAHLRAEQGHGVEVHPYARPLRQFVLREDIERDGPYVRLGTAEHFLLPLNGLPFADSVAGPPAENEWLLNFVRRKVVAPAFGLPLSGRPYRETWLCRACQGDGERLDKGQIPAIPSQNYEGTGQRLRSTPILTLAKIDIEHLKHEFFSVEMDAAAGGLFLSIRHGPMPLSVALANASPVEHIAVCRNLRKLLRAREAKA